MTEATIVLLPGDGIGPEIVTEAKKVLEAIANKHGHSFTFEEKLIGGASNGRLRSSATRRHCRSMLQSRCDFAWRRGWPQVGQPQCKTQT